MSLRQGIICRPHLFPVTPRAATAAAGGDPHTWNDAYLKAYWKMDEASGTRVDSVNGYNLTDNNTVGSAAGALNTAASFVAANLEWLSVASNSDLQTGSSDWTFVCWIKPTSVAPVVAFLIANKDDTINREWHLYVSSSAKLVGVICTAGFPTVTSTGSLTAGAWQMIAFGRRHAANEIWVSINAGTRDTAASATAPSATGAVFEIGKLSGLYYFDGGIDEALWSKRELTNAELTQLYGSGTPPGYP